MKKSILPYMKDKEIICLVPDCKKEPKTRGLCRNHYTLACILVGKKITSWSKLVANKKCTEATGSKKGKGVTGWMLSKGE